MELTRFVAGHYAPMWFTVKCAPQCTEGAKHLLRQIALLRDFSDETRAVVWPILKQNAYWAHSENVLLSMVADFDPIVRTLAVTKIRTICQNPAPEDVRHF